MAALVLGPKSENESRQLSCPSRIIASVRCLALIENRACPTQSCHESASTVHRRVGHEFAVFLVVLLLRGQRLEIPL